MYGCPSLIYLFQLGPWGVIVYHDWLFERGGEGRDGYIKSRICWGWMLAVKKDLIVAMNERNDANQKVKELTESLRVEKALVDEREDHPKI